MIASPFIFLHDDKAEKDLTAEEKKLYRFTGHLHPGITMKGQGKQTLRFPCFYFTKNYCVLPAFSRFTGTYQVHLQNDETAFAIVNDSIIKLP